MRFGPHPAVPNEVLIELAIVLAAVSPAAERQDRATPARAVPDSELRALVAARGPLRRALAAVAGELVRKRAWERLGFARLRDYAVERAGHSARSLQDLARVDAALAGLPRVEAALVEGQLTWTKARLLCRVASAEDEALWVAFAREKTARALSREVRAVDVGSLESAATDEDGVLEEERETVQLRCTPAVRARWWRARQLARRVAGEALPVWGCMEAIAAEVLSALPLDQEVESTPLAPADPAPQSALAGPTHGLPEPAAPHEPTPDGAPVEAANGCAEQGPGEHSERDPHQGQARESASSCGAHSRDAPPPPEAELPPFLASLVAGLEDADAFELDERLRRAVALEQRLEAQMGPLLLRIVEGRLHRTAGFASLDDYARERLGISPRKARALLRLERAGRKVRLLRDSYRDGQLSWVQAHALVPVLAIASAHQRAWVDHACGVTVRRLQEDVEQALVLHETDPARFEETAGLPEARQAAEGATAGHDQQPDRDVQTGAKPTPAEETCRIFWNGPRDAARLFRAVLCTVRRHIERRTGHLPTDGEALEAMLEHAFESWTTDLGDKRTRRAHRVFDRDGWRCTVPGCSSYRELHDHHIRFRSAGGSDDESNRTTLCAWHHLRGVHSGPARLRLRGRAPQRLTFELGLRRGTPPLLRYDASQRLVPRRRAREEPRFRHFREEALSSSTETGRNGRESLPWQPGKWLRRLSHERETARFLHRCGEMRR